MALFKTFGLQNGDLLIFFLRSFRKSEISKNAVSERWCSDSSFFKFQVSSLHITSILLIHVFCTNVFFQREAIPSHYFPLREVSPQGMEWESFKCLIFISTPDAAMYQGRLYRHMYKMVLRNEKSLSVCTISGNNLQMSDESVSWFRFTRAF